MPPAGAGLCSNTCTRNLRRVQQEKELSTVSERRHGGEVSRLKLRALKASARQEWPFPCTIAQRQAKPARSDALVGSLFLRRRLLQYGGRRMGIGGQRFSTSRPIAANNPGALIPGCPRSRCRDVSSTASLSPPRTRTAAPESQAPDGSLPHARRVHGSVSSPAGLSAEQEPPQHAGTLPDPSLRPQGTLDHKPECKTRLLSNILVVHALSLACHSVSTSFTSPSSLLFLVVRLLGIISIISFLLYFLLTC